MSALGQKRAFVAQKGTSALPPMAEFIDDESRTIKQKLT
jgi:hypothetical protein